MESGERSLSSEAVLEQLEWVRNLARSLVADPAAADDVAQDAWLAASRGPAPRAGSARGWLAAVTRNAARQLGRREARRRELEEGTARSGELPSTGELSERAAVQRGVVDHVLALRDPYKRTILLRYFEGLSPEAIARKEALPVATVKTRLRRGLALLREGLDEEHGDRKTWILLMSPLVPKAAAAGVGAGVMLVSAKTILGGTVAATAFVVGGVWWTQRETVPEAAELARQPATPAVQVGGIPGTEATTDSAAGRAEATERVAVETPATPAVSAGTSVDVTTVDAETGDPLGGVELWYATHEAFAADREEAGQGVFDPEVVLRRIGERYETDGDGRVTLKSGPTDRGYLVARKNDVFAMKSFRTADEIPVTLELALDRTLRIQTVDEAGVPLPGVPVGMTSREEDPSPEYRVLTEGRDAIATVPHFDQIFARELERGDVTYAVLPIPMLDTVSVEIDPARFPTEPVQLVVPPTGRVVVEVRGEAGEPLDGYRVHLESTVSTKRLGRGRGADATSEAGLAVFPYVGLGGKLLATLEPKAGENRNRITRVFDAPAAAGEEIRIEIGFEAGAPLLTGRLVDAERRPIAERSVRLRFELRMERLGTMHFETLRTDAEGRFEANLADLPDATHCRAFVTTEPAGLVGEFEVELPLLPGRNDVGDVVLAKTELLVAGRVTCDGAPVARATVHLLYDRSKRGEPAWSFVGGGTGTYTDADGRFEIHGAFEAKSYAVLANANEYLGTSPVPFEAGERDVAIEIQRAGGVAGSVVVSDGIPAKWLEVRARSQELDYDWPTTPSHAFIHPRASGKFELDRLWPGLTTVSVHVPGDDAPLAEIRDVEVAAGIARDERLQRVDLRERLFLFELTVVDESGAAVTDGFVEARPAGDPTVSPRRVTLDGKGARILTRWPALDVVVRTHGYRTAFVDGVSTDRTIALEVGVPVAVTIPADVQLPPEPAELQLALLPFELDDEFQSAPIYPADGERWTHGFDFVAGVWQTVDETRRVSFELPGEGRFRVVWQLRKPREGVAWSRSWPLESTPVEVSETTGALELAPEPGAYGAELERFLGN